jgi:hypothetical protein
MEQALASPVYRDLAAPRLAAGDPAYLFELSTLEGGEIVRLADFVGTQPVALVFGSYT